MTSVGWWASSEPLFIGEGRRLGERRSHRVSLTIDQRTRHVYGCGGSGGGKSRFQRHMIMRDVVCGRGFALWDNQDLVRETLWFIAEMALPGLLTDEKIEQLGDKLIVIDPSNLQYGSAGFNFLAARPGLHTFELVDALVQLLAELFEGSMGPRLIDVTRMSLLCLAEQGLTIAEMPLFLSDSAVRNALVRRSRNPEVQTFFLAHLGGLRESDVRVWLESSRNKWNSIASPFIMNFIGQAQSTIDFSDIIDHGKILLINLSRAHLKQESRAVFGGMLLNSLHQAAIARENTPHEQRYFYAFYIDEMQTYYTSTIAELVEAGRKYGIGCHLFHQSTRQEPFATNRGAIDTILANCHCRLCFGVARQDAERMAAEFFAPTATQIKYQTTVAGIPNERPQFWSMGEEMEGYTAELMHQQTREAFVSLKGLGDDPRPYVIRTPFVADISPDPAKVEALMNHVARRYYRPINEIKREVEQRWNRLRAMAQTDQGPPQPNDFRR